MKFTLILVALSGAALASPSSFELTRDGGVWRLLTGHLAHYSLYHFAVDAGTLLVVGRLVERHWGARRWALVCAASALSISLAFLLFETRLDVYRGLSGLDCTAFAAMLSIEARRHRGPALALAVVFAAKLAYEQITGGFLFPSTGWGDMGSPVLSAHTVGALGGFLGSRFLLETKKNSPYLFFMVLPKVLVASSKPDSRRRLIDVLEQSKSPLRAVAVEDLADLVPRLQREGFDATVLALEGPDDLALIERIREAKPEVPLYLVADDADLRERAGKANVGTVVRAEMLVTALEARQASRVLIQRVARSAELAEDVARLVREGRNLLTRVKSKPRPFPTLLVEDNPDHALLTMRALTRAGFPDPIRLVSDGEEAIAYLGGTGEFADRDRFPLPSLVLLDLHLPRKSGFDVLDWARRQPGLRELPIVLLTTSDLPEDQERARVLGATGYRVKPFDLHDLTAIARDLLKTFAAR